MPRKVSNNQVRQQAFQAGRARREVLSTKGLWEVVDWSCEQKKYENPQDLADACQDYFQWLEDNPFYEAKHYMAGVKADMAEIPKMRVPLLKGLCAFVGCSTDAWRRWKTERPDLLPVIELAEDLIYEAKFTGAAAGFFKEGIIMRDLGLADKQELTGKDGGAIQTEELTNGAAEFTRKLSSLAASRRTRAASGGTDDGGEGSA